MRPSTESLIFDMDGTLWDAVDSYREVWLEAYRRLGLHLTLTRPQLLACMGLPLAEIFKRVAPQAPIAFDDFKPTLRQVEQELMPKLGGRLYPDVRPVLEELTKRGYRLFMVSNCSPNGLPNFLNFTGLTPLFTDTLSYGQTGLDKDGNIRALIERYSLKAPVYVVDIEADCASAHAAGIPMLWVSWGFGQAPDADMRADAMTDLLKLFN